jgi:hypothetical protein
VTTTPENYAAVIVKLVPGKSEQEKTRSPSTELLGSPKALKDAAAPVPGNSVFEGG